MEFFVKNLKSSLFEESKINLKAGNDFNIFYCHRVLNRGILELYDEKIRR